MDIWIGPTFVVYSVQTLPGWLQLLHRPHTMPTATPSARPGPILKHPLYAIGHSTNINILYT